MQQEKETQPAITLSVEQKALFNIMEKTQQHLFITGRAGAGKSLLLRHFRENTTKKVVIAAPTGIAALNVKGQTLHSLFKLPPQLHRKGNLQPNPKACTLLKRIDTLVIDEISMVRADLLDAVDERLREATKKDIPFGGVQVIMFGDVYQLPPVVEEGLMPYFEAVHGGYFFFHALAWKETEFKIYELTQVFRQKDPVFKDILNAVRDGSVNDGQLEALNARYGVTIPASGTVILAPTNNLVTTINQQRLDQLPGQVYEYKALVTGEMKKSTFPTEENIYLKVGAQVVLLQNDQNKRWVNGTVATIAHLKKDEKSERIAVKVDGIDYDLEKATWEEIRYEYDPISGKVKSDVVSSFTQYPIRLAWALTIHKSQGQTYESSALDLTTPTFAPGQMYVALSRCTSLEGLYLKMPVLRKHIIVEAKVVAFMANREAITLEDEQAAAVEAAEAIVTEQPAPINAQIAEVMNDTAEEVQAATAPANGHVEAKKPGRKEGFKLENHDRYLQVSLSEEALAKLADMAETLHPMKASRGKVQGNQSKTIEALILQAYDAFKVEQDNLAGGEEASLPQTTDQQNAAIYQEKLSEAGQHIAKLQRQVEIQHEKLGQYYMRFYPTSLKVAEERLLALGALLGYKRMLKYDDITVEVGSGVEAWRTFATTADYEKLAQAILQAQRLYEEIEAVQALAEAKREASRA